MHTNSPEQAARYATRWNGLMAAGQITASAATGNLGFAAEAVHNTADAVSFDAKRRAMNSPLQARRLRKIAATILTVGGLGAISGGAYHAVLNENENAEPIALGIAVAGASINTIIARRAHNAVDHNGNHCHEAHGAHSDSKLHAITDAATGWLYVGGLALETRHPGTANYAVILNGMISTSAGLATFKNIARS